MRPEALRPSRAERQTAAFGAQRVDDGPQLQQAIEPVLLDAGWRDAACPELVEGRNSSVSHPCGHHFCGLRQLILGIECAELCRSGAVSPRLIVA